MKHMFATLKSYSNSFCRTPQISHILMPDRQEILNNRRGCISTLINMKKMQNIKAPIQL